MDDRVARLVSLLVEERFFAGRELIGVEFARRHALEMVHRWVFPPRRKLDVGFLNGSQLERLSRVARLDWTNPADREALSFAYALVFNDHAG